MDVQQKKRRKIPWGRLCALVVVILMVVVGSVLWIAENQGPWIGILPTIIFAVMGVILALFQWLFPLPSGSTDVPAVQGNSYSQTTLPPIIVHVPQVSGPLSSPPSAPFVQTAYCSLESVPPPTDPRTIQQREMSVKDVYVKLTQPDISAIALTGIGGVGKSTLAALVYRYAEEQRRAGKGLFTAEALWLKIDSSSITMADLIGNIFQVLNKPMPDISNLAAHNQAAILFNALNTVEHARLIVLDQFENLLDWRTGYALVDSPGIGEWLDAINGQACKCRILLTSRPWPQGNKGYHPTYMQEFQVVGLSISEGSDLLRKLGLVATESELRQAVENCAGHAYALTLLAALLRHRHLSLGAFFKDPTYSHLWTGNVARNLLDRIYGQQLDELQRKLLLAFSIYREPVLLEAACAIADPDQKLSFTELHLSLDGLLMQHLLQSTGEGRYQLHAIGINYAHDHFDPSSEQANQRALRATHIQAAQYYQQYALKHCPRRSERRKRSDIESFEEAIWHYCQAEQWQLAYALIEQEGIYYDLLRWGYAVVLREIYEFFFPLTKWPTPPVHEARIYDELGEVYWYLGQLAQAQQCFEQALSLARTTHNRREEGFALNFLGQVYADHGKKQESLHYYLEALAIHKEVGNLGGEGTVLDNIGWSYYDIGLMDLAREKYREALRIRREAKDRIGEAHVLNSLGRIYENMGLLEDARRTLETALVICRDVDSRHDEGWTLNNLGRVYAILGQKEQARAYFEQALPIRREVGDRRGEGATLSNLGLLLVSMGERERAYASYMSALLIRREVGDRSGEGKTLNYLGLLYADWGRYEQAISYFKQALRIRQEIGHIKRQGKTLNSLGRCYVALHRYDFALACYLHAQELFATLQTSNSGVELRENLTQEYLDELSQALGAQEFAALLASVRPSVQSILAELLKSDGV